MWIQRLSEPIENKAWKTSISISNHCFLQSKDMTIMWSFLQSIEDQPTIWVACCFHNLIFVDLQIKFLFDIESQWISIADPWFLWKSLSSSFMRMTWSVGDGCFWNSILPLFWVLFYKLFALGWSYAMQFTCIPKWC